MKPSLTSPSLLIPFLFSLALHAAVLPLLPSYWNTSGKPEETRLSVAVDLVRLVTVPDVEPVVATPEPPAQKLSPSPEVTHKPVQKPLPSRVREVAHAVDTREKHVAIVAEVVAPAAISLPAETSAAVAAHVITLGDEPAVGDTDRELRPAPFGSSNGVRYARQVMPEYPRVARRMGWEGEVVVQARIRADGRAAEATILQSSSYEALDESARKAIEQSIYLLPAHHEAEAEVIAEIPIIFRLR